MKKQTNLIFLEKLSSIAVGTMKASANSTCGFISHQAKMPKKLKKFKK